jgi:SAM-dependent methyltransferase
MKGVKSTLFNDGACELIETFEASKIIEKYSKEIGVDIERFFEGINQVKLYNCIETGYRFYYPESIIGDAKFYEDLAKARQSYYSRRWEHIQALNYIRKTDEILEVGSGFGSFLELLKDNKINNVKGIELSRLAMEKCKEKQLNVESKLIEDLDEKNKFDVVCSFQVLEHVYDVKSFLDSAIKVLKPGGKLMIGVPNNNPYLHVLDKLHTLNLPPHHAGLWSKKALCSLTKIYPIKIVDIEFEPLLKSYNDFLNFHLHYNKSKILRLILRLSNKFSQKQTKRILNKVIKGRNVLAVFEKK